jgi:hypothetical protein
MGLRRGRITKPDSDRFLAAIAGINVLLNDPSSYESIFAFAEEHGLTFYDAAYLSLAKEQHLPLATLDKQLPKAADPAGVQLFHPEIFASSAGQVAASYRYSPRCLSRQGGQPGRTQ